MTLRSRIVTGFAIVTILVVGLGIAVVAAQRGRLIEQLDRQLEAIAPLERPAPPSVEPDPGRTDRDRPLQEPISDVFIAAVLDDGTVDVLVEGQLLDDVPDTTAFADEMVTERTFDTVDSADGSTSFRVLVDPFAEGVVVIAVPTTDVDETVRNLAITFLIAALVIAAILGVIASWIVRLGLRPISAITRTARSISQGDRGERAPEIDDRTEAGQLAAAFNVMLDQRDEAEDTLRRFASDASHELRTPLTSIRGYLDLYEAGGFREPGQLDDVVRRMQDEANRMSGLVEQLLQLARLDEMRQLAVSPVDVDQLLSDVVANAKAGHPDRDIVASTPAGSAVEVHADRDRIKQLVAVLVDNAVIHATEASIEVRAEESADGVVIVVADDGPGLGDVDAARVFTRFYRSASSRSRATGGSGLGLAIAQSIAEAHGGSISLRTSPGEGCEFTIDLPASPPPDHH